ncbi:hypothetical protein JAAARDRAFT_612311 [Jaapia argillacea MUCL 33604]|uniref:Uncharacterized protein n=1 Tax=Jaapia argillacea MUCL 33604 TaxID=933084 RepID=A0A067P7V2_9AGAM|nr:hypothetical protein JAAARDRAFT_612311 [Jaapia argillacea MUCL 33604]
MSSSPASFTITRLLSIPPALCHYRPPCVTTAHVLSLPATFCHYQPPSIATTRRPSPPPHASASYWLAVVRWVLMGRYPGIFCTFILRYQGLKSITVPSFLFFFLPSSFCILIYHHPIIIIAARSFPSPAHYTMYKYTTYPYARHHPPYYLLGIQWLVSYLLFL